MNTTTEPRRMSDFLLELMENPQTPAEVRRKSSLFLETLPVSTLESIVSFNSPYTPIVTTPVHSQQDAQQPSTRIVIKQQEPVQSPNLQPSPVYNQEPCMYPPITDFILQELARNPAFAMQVASMFMPQQQTQQPFLPFVMPPAQQQQGLVATPTQYNFEQVIPCADSNKSSSPTIVAAAPKPVVHAPGEAYILLRGARKSVFADLNAVQELNSLPYKYCFKLVLPYANDKEYHAKVNSDHIKMELLCVDSATQESVVENGITVEKLMRTKRYADRRELEYKVYLSAYSHGFNKGSFVIKVFDAQTGHVIMRSQALPIFARRNQAAQPQGEATKKRKREASQDAGDASPSKKSRNKSL